MEHAVGFTDGKHVAIKKLHPYRGQIVQLQGILFNCDTSPFLQTKN